ncbi:MAG: efflux RND transporter periplasmic adaptor subunit [Planctomycetes bacterium]|nr:efflux RND transporter periplasmic adaptor subunit [Planctomycetota bacterium]
MFKKIILALIVIGAAYGIYRWRSSGTETKSEKKETSTVAKVSRGLLRILVESTGSVVPEQEVEIKCKASGEITKLPVDISDLVKKDDLLAQLDPENEERSVRKAKVTLAVSEAKLAQAKLELKIAEKNLVSNRLRTEAALASAQTSEKETKSKLNRYQQLREKKMTSEENYEAAESDYAKAFATLKTAQADVEDLNTQEIQIESLRHSIMIAEQEVESNAIALDDAKESLDETTVTSPISGVVAEREVQVGQIIASGVSNVSGGTTIMTIADLSRIYVLVSVDESDIGRIELNQPATITVDAYPHMKMTGKVVRIATKGTTTSNVVTFEVKVEVTSENKRLLKPEMTANVDITVVDNPKALLVPVKAVRTTEKGSFVNVMLSGQKENRKIKTGESDGENIEVISGLAENDEIVVPSAGESNWKSTKKAQTQRRGPPGPML